MTEERRSGIAKKENAKDNVASERPLPSGSDGACEAQLWRFIGPQRILIDDDVAEIHWVAAESLDASLRYMRRRFEDFTIAEARLVGVIPLLSGSPLD